MQELLKVPLMNIPQPVTLMMAMIKSTPPPVIEPVSVKQQVLLTLAH